MGAWMPVLCGSSISRRLYQITGYTSWRLPGATYYRLAHKLGFAVDFVLSLCKGLLVADVHNWLIARIACLRAILCPEDFKTPRKMLGHVAHQICVREQLQQSVASVNTMSIRLTCTARWGPD